MQRGLGKYKMFRFNTAESGIVTDSVLPNLTFYFTKASLHAYKAILFQLPIVICIGS